MSRFVKAEHFDDQRAMADKFFYGEGMQQDLSEALRLYLIAAENGDQIAQNFLNICLENLNLSLENIHQINKSDWFAETMC